MSDINLRLEALRLAAGTSNDSDKVVVAAGRYFAFLAQADAPAPAESAPRLDDPKLVAKTKEIVATATPKLTAGSSSSQESTTADEPASSSEAGSDATTADGPLTADQIAELRKNANAAVLLAVKPDKLGRDPTVAILKKHGGAKVPEVPVENLAALTAELNTAMGL